MSRIIGDELIEHWWGHRMRIEDEGMAAQPDGCPFCGELIRTHGERCVYCGERLVPATRESVMQDQTEEDWASLGDVDGFTLAYLRGADLRGAYLSGVDLFGVRLVGADLRGADLGGANLSGADLSYADLSSANLHTADLSDAKLSGADLRDAELTDATLTGATFDIYTTWPEDYDPVSAGAVNKGRG
jgi:hypothetical protein